MDDGSITLLAALIILVAFSAFFSASETAFSSLNQIRLKSRAEDGDSAAARVLAMSEKYDKLLSTILIGNNIVNIAAASIGTVLFTRLLDPERGATVSTFVLTIVVLIFGEVTPKSLAKEMPETVATAVSPMLNLLMVLFTPLTWLFSQWKRLLGHFVHSTEEDTITEGELMTMVSEAENDGELTDRESQLIRSAIEFDDVEVEEILTPRVDVIAVEDDLSLDEVADTFAESGYSRLPVYHGTIDNIIGVVHEKDFYLGRLRKDTTLEDLVKPTLYTTGSTQISQLLRTLREQHHHMAVVVDEYGGTEGIITLEDILEELVGEIWDEHDEATEDFRRQSDGSWIVLGSAGVDDLYERLGLPEDEDIDSNTVNGLVQEKTCHLPKVGDRFTLGEYDGVVTRTAKRRVTEVRLTPAEKPEPKKESSGTAKSWVLGAHLNGTVVPMDQVKDEVFASGALGDGVAIEPTEGKLYAPADCTVVNIFETKHAIGLSVDDDVELLLHIGIDTVKMGGKGFEAHVKEGQTVKKGDLLVSFDMDAIKAAGYLCTTPMIVCNTDDYKEIKAVASGTVKASQDLLEIKN